jgi:hypothetical protein
VSITRRERHVLVYARRHFHLTPLDRAPEGRLCGHGFRSFDNYRLKVLLHAGGIRWPERAVAPPLRTLTPQLDA